MVHVRFAGAAIVLLLAGATCATSEDDPVPGSPGTRLEALLATKGSKVVKESHPVGNIRGLSLEVLVLVEREKESERVKGLRAEITMQGDGSKAHSSFLDPDEVTALLRAVDHMGRQLKRWKRHKRESFSEVSFVTRGNFRLGCQLKGNERTIFASSGVTEKANFYGDAEELPQLLKLLKMASEKLARL